MLKPIFDTNWRFFDKSAKFGREIRNDLKFDLAETKFAVEKITTFIYK